MLIRSIELTRVELPLAGDYVFGRGVVDRFVNIVIHMTGSDGTVGIGECVVRSIVSNVDEAHRRLQAVIPSLIGMDSLDMEAIISKMMEAPWEDLGPVAGIDMALWDLNGKALGLPVYKLAGGAYDLRIPCDYTISIDAPGVMARTALEMMARGGYGTFVVKTGRGTTAEDIDRVRAVREAVGPAVRLRVDANAAYGVAEAVEVINGVERFDIEFFEQPIPRGDVRKYEEVASKVGVPLAVDEGLETVADAVEFVRSGAVSVFNIKVPQCGGILLSKKIALIAEGAGIRCICGGRLALDIARRASQHFVASTKQACCGMAHEGTGPASQPVTASVVACPMTYEGIRANRGFVSPPDAPGLGVDLDLDALQRYRVR